MANNKLHKVRDYAALKEEKAAAELQKSREESQKKQEQLNLLNQYREEYEQQFQQRCSGGIDARSLEDYRLFLKKLNAAIAEQTTQVSESENGVQQAQSNWLDTYRRKSVLGNLIERKEQALDVEKQRLEQKISDENAARQKMD